MGAEFEKNFLSLTFGMRGWRVGMNVMTGERCQNFSESSGASVPIVARDVTNLS
jgi:hypothetical protein